MLPFIKVEIAPDNDEEDQQKKRTLHKPKREFNIVVIEGVGHYGDWKCETEAH